MRLVHLPEADAEPWAIFEEIKGEKFKNFNTVREKINELTDKVAGVRKGIVDQPIILKIYSPTCPDLTLIDLPGITRIPLKGSDHPENIEQITKEMAARYCGDPSTLILCVVPANIDMTTSDALQMAQKLDPKGIRTLGVITKVIFLPY